MKDKVIMTDCDGVILDWEYGFARYMANKGLKPIRNDVYSVGDTYGIPKSEGKAHVIAFNESARIGHLPPFRDAVKYVRKIHEELGMVFHVITSLSDDPYARLLRIENLERVFGVGIFEEVICIGCGDDKDDALEPYRDSGCLWVEDKLINAETGAKMGLDSVLIEHTHNKNLNNDSIRSVKNWREIYESLV